MRYESVDLIDLSSSKIIHTFLTEPTRPRSMKFVYSGQRRGPDGKGTVSSLTLAYLSDEDGECVLQTYLPSEGHDNICVSDATGPPSARSSCAWAVTNQIKRRIRNPGVWTPLRNGCMIGLRRKARETTPSGSPIRGRLSDFAQATTGLRRRAGHGVAINSSGNNAASSSLSSSCNPTTPTKAKAEETYWEIWVITRLEQQNSPINNIETRPLIGPDDPAGLIISDLGPIAKVGYGSIAVGFGNVVKVITVGHEWFDRIEPQGGGFYDMKGDSRPQQYVSSSRRRKQQASVGGGSSFGRTRASSNTFRPHPPPTSIM